jgi:hypothetical protein
LAERFSWLDQMDNTANLRVVSVFVHRCVFSLPSK